MNIYMKLKTIQKNLKVGKGRKNNFGDYYYRSCEDILEAVKVKLDELDCILLLDSEIFELNGKVFVKSIATFIDCIDGQKITASASVEKDQDRKKMDQPQISGAAISYSRKYALNGLFLLDDTKDNDSEEYQRQNKEVSQTQSSSLKPIKTEKVNIEANENLIEVKRKYIGNEIIRNFGKDKPKEILEYMTKFEKDGKEISGFTRLSDLKDKRLDILYFKIQKLQQLEKTDNPKFLETIEKIYNEALNLHDIPK